MASRTSCGEITRFLLDWSEGSQDALDRLLPIVYEELCLLAGSYLRRERSDHTLRTVDLVHEAYLRLVDQDRVRWQNRAHFYGIAARIMRRILVDHARAKASTKRGAGVTALSLDEALTLADERAPELVALDDALEALARLDPDQARVVELRFFAGMTGKQIAQVLGISPSTVAREWDMAKLWLYRELSQASDFRKGSMPMTKSPALSRVGG